MTVLTAGRFVVPVACVLLPGSLFALQADRLTIEDQGTLTAGERQHRTLPAAVVHRWSVEVSAGQFAQLEVLQDGLDVVLRIRDPDGAVVREVDGPTGAAGTERLAWIAGRGGNWVAEVVAFQADQSGDYEITLTPFRAALDLDSMRIEADSLMAQASLSEARQALAGHESAIPQLQRAANLYHRLADGSSEAAALDAIGRIQLALSRPDSAMPYYRQALAILRELDDPAGEYSSLLGIGSVLQYSGRSDSALAYYHQSLVIVREHYERQAEAWTLGHIAGSHHHLGQLDSALVYMNLGLTIHRELGNRHGEALGLGDIGVAYTVVGRQDSALAHFYLALPIFREVGNRVGEAAALTNIGVVHSGLGRQDSALSYLRAALPIQREIGDRETEAATLGYLARSHAIRGRLDSALVYLRMTLSFQRTLGDPRGTAYTLFELAATHQELGRPDSALVYLHMALSIFRDIRDPVGHARTLANIGAVHFSLGRQDSALVFHRQAIAIQRETGDRRNEALTLNHIGNTFRALGSLDSAIGYQHAAQAIQLEVGDRRGEARTLADLGVLQNALGRTDSALASFGSALALFREQGERIPESQVLGNIASLLRQLGDPDLIAALAYFDSAAAAWGGVRERAGPDPDRVSFGERFVRLFEGWVLGWLTRSPQVGTREAALAALAASERGRAQALLDLQRDSLPGLRPGTDLVAEGATLAAAATRNGMAVISYMLTVDTLVTWLLLPSGELLVRRHSIARDSLATMVATFRRALGVDATAQLAQLALRGAAALDAPMEDLAPDIGRAPAATVAGDLAEILLPHAFRERLHGIPELVVAPQGPLSMLPFAALPLTEWDPLRGGDLGVRYALRYAPSLASLRLAEERPSQDVRADMQLMASALVVGDPAMPELTDASGVRDTLRALPQARVEAQWLAERMNVRPLLGTDASEGVVKARMNGAPIVHLATHGYAFASEARARNSFVALTPAEGHDGHLTVEDLLDDPDINLVAELVVLSACQTGLGNVKQAEGTIGLQRAFLANGARSVLVSLWSVSDVVTTELMKRFYTHWLDDTDTPSKAEALRRAQEDIRNTPGWEHPRFWAAFQLVGAR